MSVWGCGVWFVLWILSWSSNCHLYIITCVLYLLSGLIIIIIIDLSYLSVSNIKNELCENLWHRKVNCFQCIFCVHYASIVWRIFNCLLLFFACFFGCFDAWLPLLVPACCDVCCPNFYLIGYTLCGPYFGTASELYLFMLGE